MDLEKINNEQDDSHISLEESFYCSNPKLGVKSISAKNNTENLNIFQENNKNQINNFTFSINKEASTNYISKEKTSKNDYKSNKKNKHCSIKRLISHPIIYESNYEDENFISHSIKFKERNISLYKSSDDIKEKDRKNKNIFHLTDNYRKNRMKIRKNTDNLFMNKISDFRESKKLRKKSSPKNYIKSDTHKHIGNYLFSSNNINNEIKIDKHKRNEFHLKSSINLREKSCDKIKEKENEKNNRHKNRIALINSINERHLNKIYSLERLTSNKSKLKKENTINNNFYNTKDFGKKYSSNIELQKYKSMDIKIKLEMGNQNPINSTEKLILNYKNKKEIIEILSDKENINNYYEYMEICFQTLQDINIKEVPKSNYKLKLSFPKEMQNKKIALFDLDETLVHCVGEINEKNKENKTINKIKVLLPNKKEILIGINIRPHWKDSLDKIKNIYNIIIFTASHRAYSDAVLNYLDPDNQYFKYRLYRDSCVQYKSDNINFYVKDLDIFKEKFDLKDIIIIDNSILSFAYHLNNGIPVVSFYDSEVDTELPLLSYYLLSIANYNDLRIANQEHIKLEYFLKQIKYKEIESITTKKNISIVEFKEDEENNDNKNKDIPEVISIIDNKKEYYSEKKVFHISNFNRVYPENKKLNSIKNESNKNIDFFEKWKNAYLRLSIKK